MKIRTLIVDDEPLARARMERLLKSIDGVELVGVAENGQQAVSMAEKLSPNLILMDVQMPHMTGIEAARKIAQQSSDEPPTVIFCTAYDRYAIDAFHVNASSYLLKPISVADLGDAIHRASTLTQLQKTSQSELSEGADYLSIKQLNSVEKRHFDEINYFRSEGKHVVVGLLDGSEVFVDQTLKELEDRYQAKLIRVHRNSLICRDKLMRLVREPGNDYVELKTCDITFSVSRRMLSEVKKCFG